MSGNVERGRSKFVQSSFRVVFKDCTDGEINLRIYRSGNGILFIVIIIYALGGKKKEKPFSGSILATLCKANIFIPRKIYMPGADHVSSFLTGEKSFSGSQIWFFGKHFGAIVSEKKSD